MNGSPEEEGWTPSAKLLAAYTDGELAEEGPTAELRRRIEAWLAEHPEAVAEVETQQRLLEWCQATAAVDPGERAWAAAGARLHASHFPPPHPRGRWPRRAWWTGLGATAAGIALALYLASPPAGPDVSPAQQDNPSAQAGPGSSSRAPEAEVLPVASAAEVEILSVQGEDTATLVVGELPVEGSLVLLTADEVTLTSIEPARDNMVPEMRKGTRAPMIWAPLDAERADPEE